MNHGRSGRCSSSALDTSTSSSTSSPRRNVSELFSTTFRDPSCRPLSGNRRPPGRCCSSRPYLRHFFIEDLFLIQIRYLSCRFRVGPWSADGAGRCCNRRPRLRNRPLNEVFPSCSGQRFAILRAAPCRGTVGVLDGAAPVDLVLDISSSNTCSRYRFAVIRVGSCRVTVSWWFWKVL